MSKINKVVYFILSLVFFTISDLYLSELILSKLRFNLKQNGFIDLIFVQNTGAAFNILENYRIFLIIFAIFAILTILIYIFKQIENFSTLFMFWASILVSGISCNLYERINFGYVRDFFKLNFIDFPIFNISDIFINIGVLAIIIIIIKNKYIKNNKIKED